jgi:thiamine phosphate synthase YjbQ (UPF0047 family)
MKERKRVGIETANAADVTQQGRSFLMNIPIQQGAMHLWTLEEQANPLRRSHIGVIEELAQGRTRRVDRARLQRQSEHRVHERASDDGVHDHFTRMLVKGSDDLDPLRTVMYLME